MDIELASSNPSYTLIDAPVRSFMTTPVKTIDLANPLSDGVRMMKESNVGCLVVVENDKPVGIFTERDLVKIISERTKPLELKMSHIMSKPLSTIAPIATLWDAIALMGRLDIRRLPVVEDGKLVGILTEKDIFRLIIARQNLILESVAEYLPTMTREQLKGLITQFGDQRPPSLH